MSDPIYLNYVPKRIDAALPIQMVEPRMVIGEMNYSQLISFCHNHPELITEDVIRSTDPDHITPEGKVDYVQMSLQHTSYDFMSFLAKLRHEYFKQKLFFPCFQSGGQIMDNCWMQTEPDDTGLLPMDLMKIFMYCTLIYCLVDIDLYIDDIKTVVPSGTELPIERFKRSFFPGEIEYFVNDMRSLNLPPERIQKIGQALRTNFSNKKSKLRLVPENEEEGNILKYYASSDRIDPENCSINDFMFYTLVVTCAAAIDNAAFPAFQTKFKFDSSMYNLLSVQKFDKLFGHVEHLRSDPDDFASFAQHLVYPDLFMTYMYDWYQVDEKLERFRKSLAEYVIRGTVAKFPDTLDPEHMDEAARFEREKLKKFDPFMIRTKLSSGHQKDIPNVRPITEGVTYAGVIDSFKRTEAWKGHSFHGIPTPEALEMYIQFLNKPMFEPTIRYIYALPEEDRHALFYYTSGKGSRDINTAMSGRYSSLPTFVERRTESIRLLYKKNEFVRMNDTINRLLQITSHAPPIGDAFKVYRGAAESEAENYIFLSTTLEKSVAASFLTSRYEGDGAKQLRARWFDELGIYFSSSTAKLGIHVINVMRGARVLYLPSRMPSVTVYSEDEIFFAPEFGKMHKLYNRYNPAVDEVIYSVFVYEPYTTSSSFLDVEDPDVVFDRYRTETGRDIEVQFGRARAFIKHYLRKNPNKSVEYALKKYVRGLMEM